MAGDEMRRERSAGGVVVRRVEEETRVLVIRDPYQQWGLPKGHLEEGEDLREAAVREVREETGLERVRSGPELDTIDWYFRSDEVLVHKFCTFFLMHSPAGEVEPETEEGITECVWLSVDAAVERVSYDNAREVVRKAGRLLADGGPDAHPFDLP